MVSPLSTQRPALSGLLRSPNQEVPATAVGTTPTPHALTRIVRGHNGPAQAWTSGAASLSADHLQAPICIRNGPIPTTHPGPVTRPVVRQGDQFTLDGKPFRFVGMNVYNLAWVAERNPEELERTLRTIAASGTTVVRFWAFPGRSPEAVGRIFDTSQQLGLGLRFIPVLGNHWAEMEVGKEAKTKDRDWYGGGYKDQYLPHLLAMVQAHGERPEVLLWEVINEPVTPHLDKLYGFVRDAAAAVKANGGRMTAVGSFGSVQGGQPAPYYRALAALPDVDAVSMHDYIREWGKGPLSTGILTWWGDREVRLNTRIARDVGKPFYLGEFGTKVSHCGWQREGCAYSVKTPAEALEGNVGRAQRAFRNGAQGVLMWGPQPEGNGQDGHGFGFTFRQDDQTSSAVGWAVTRMRLMAGHASPNE